AGARCRSTRCARSRTTGESAAPPSAGGRRADAGAVPGARRVLLPAGDATAVRVPARLRRSPALSDRVVVPDRATGPGTRLAAEPARSPADFLPPAPADRSGQSEPLRRAPAGAGPRRHRGPPPRRAAARGAD